MLRGLVGTQFRDRESRPSLKDTENHNYDLVRGKGRPQNLYSNKYTLIDVKGNDSLCYFMAFQELVKPQRPVS